MAGRILLPVGLLHVTEPQAHSEKCKIKNCLVKLVQVVPINIGSLRLTVAGGQAKIHILRETHREKQ